MAKVTLRQKAIDDLGTIHDKSQAKQAVKCYTTIKLACIKSNENQTKGENMKELATFSSDSNPESISHFIYRFRKIELRSEEF